jgi:hypothetical protein
MSDDDIYAERLRQVLHGEGSAMEIADDGLGRILQEGNASGGASRRPSWLAPLAVAATIVVLLGAAALGVGLYNGGGNKTSTPPVGGSLGTSTSPSTSAITSTAGPSPSTGTSVSTPPTSSTATSSATSTPPPSAPVALGIYYVADVPGVGTRLYREFHSLPVTGGKAMTALAELFGGNAVDPDYTSFWPSGTEAQSLTTAGTTATLDVNQFPDAGTTAQVLAIQQVVWTVTAADPSITAVQVTVNGKAPKGPASLAKPTTRANALDTEANVWILSPTEGATVSSPVKVTVYGTGNEGNVPIEIYQGNTRVAAKAVTTQMGAFAQASTSFTLPAGSYEVRAYNDNGKNGTLLLWDTKSFTVQ